MPTALNSVAVSSSAVALSELLPHIRSFAQVAQVYHWRVTGPLFGVIHPLFGELYAALVDYADNAAERIAQLGGEVPWRIPEYPPLADSDGAALARDCGKMAQQFGARAYAAMEALQGNDRVFLAKLEELQGGVEKLVWQIEQHATR